MLGAINHIAVSVIDLASSDKFWEPIMSFLGYKRTLNSDELSVWESAVSGSAINFWLAKNGGDYKYFATGLHHIAFNADKSTEVDEFFSLLQNLDVEILDAPAMYNEYEEGYYAVFFKDINGFKIELAYTPSTAETVIGG